MKEKIILSANTEWYLYNFRFSLARFLRKQGYQVILASPPGKYVDSLRIEGFHWIPLHLGRKSVAPWQEMASLLQLVQIYRRERPALVHHHTIKPVIYGSLAARLAGVPAVVNSITGRGYVFLGDDLQAKMLRQVAHMLYRPALASERCAVIFENENDRRYFQDNKLASPERTFLIEGVGVDPEQFSPLPEPEGIPVIGMPARMLRDKGVGVLVEAARLLHDRVPARVALIGTPDPGNPNSVDEATLRAWDSEGVIEWWGWQDDMRSVYARCHIVTLPTMYGEGVPTALLEAAACARPLVATDIPGCRAVVVNEETGFIVPVNDSAALADALERLARDPALRCKLGEQGRELIMQKYTDTIVNNATLDVYKQVLKQNS